MAHSYRLHVCLDVSADDAGTARQQVLESVRAGRLPAGWVVLDRDLKAIWVDPNAGSGGGGDGDGEWPGHPGERER